MADPAAFVLPADNLNYLNAKTTQEVLMWRIFYTILIRNPARKRVFWRHNSRWRNTTKTDLKKK
jgi:hypothetical protein